MKATIRFDNSEVIGMMKPMNAVNNGPVRARKDQTRGNFDSYSKAGFSYARTHDSNLCYDYGGPHTVDISAIFPNFDADENDSASYDFTITDEYIENIIASGTKVFYRLGQSIEHWIKKYGIYPPKDFQKWARICEHIILHFNEGWANGYHYGIEYWEIWNEPDLDCEGSPNPRCWGGTKAQFFDLYEIAAKHLKSKFPHLKIGGPALASRREWAIEFLQEMHRRNVPIDFFSWHKYDTDPHNIGERCDFYRNLLDENGYQETESILNEWNYVRDWTSQFIYSLRAVNGIKGASFATAVMCECQRKPVDMLMYYDARIDTPFNGLFDFVAWEPRKTYYPYLAFHRMTLLRNEVRLECDNESIYAITASDGKQTQILLTYYDENDESAEGEVELKFKVTQKSKMCFFLTDEKRDMEQVRTMDLLEGEQSVRLPIHLFDVFHITVTPCV